MEALEFAKKICKTLDDHKAEDIVCIDVKGKTEVAEELFVSFSVCIEHGEEFVANLLFDALGYISQLLILLEHFS